MMNYSNITDSELADKIKLLEGLIDSDITRLNELKRELETRANKPVTGDVFRYGEHLYIVRYDKFTGKFFTTDEYGIECDNTDIYKKYFPNGVWKRVGNVFTMFK